MDKLEQYQKKRDFNKTPEPKAKIAEKSKKPIFVIQKHAARNLHYDFRIEIDGVLKSWAIPKGPSLNPHEKRLAVLTEDHPFAYKDFEGIIPEGEYGAGSVIIWDQGTYKNERSISESDSFKDGKIVIKLDGDKLKGDFVLVKTKGSFGRNPEKNWLLIKMQDKYADEKQDILTNKPESIISGKLK